MIDSEFVEPAVIVRHILRDCISLKVFVFGDETTCRVRVDRSVLVESGVRKPDCRISASRLCTTDRWPRFWIEGLCERVLDGV